MFDENEFNSMIKDIITNEKFIKLKYEKHHGTTRYKHLVNTAKLTYIVAKKMKFKNIKDVTRAAILHDFFYNDELCGKINLLTHSKYAAEKAKKEFNITDLEYSMIKSHMFPISTYIPRNKESILLLTTDKIVSLYDLYNMINLDTK